MGYWNTPIPLLRNCRAESIRKFLDLPAVQRCQIFYAYCLLGAVEWLLHWRSSAWIIRWLNPPVPSPASFNKRALSQEELASLAKAVALADSHGVLASSCLRKSLALACWLKKYGADSRLRLGVNKEGGFLQAHAWLEVAGPAGLVRFFEEPGFAELS